MKFQFAPAKVLDFDIENRPLTYLGSDFTTAEVTAIAASFGANETMHCWLLGKDDPVDMLEKFRALYNKADIVTGHYIRKHDLPIITGALAEYGLPPLEPKLTIDTKLDLVWMKDLSKSQEALSGMYNLPLGKTHMTQPMWREANRLTNAKALKLTKDRVTGDVRQHQLLYMKLLDCGLLGTPRTWRP